MRSLRDFIVRHCKVLLICLGVLVLVIGGTLTSYYYFFKPCSLKYTEALNLMENYSYLEAQALFNELGTYRQSTEKSSELANYIYVEQLMLENNYEDAIKWLNSIPPTVHVTRQFQHIYEHALALNEANDYLPALSIFLRLKDFEDSRSYANELIKKADMYYSTHLVSGYNHELYLSPDGFVTAIGDNLYKQCNVSNWEDICAIYAKANYSVGINQNGKLLITGDITPQGESLRDWSNIKEVILLSEPKLEKAFGLTYNGTVMSSHGNAEVEKWSNIDHIYSSKNHIVGLKKDGTVIATGTNKMGQCNVDTWKDIIQIIAGSDYTLGLTTDGKVLLAGNVSSREAILNWSDIIYLFSNDYLTIGLKSDGTLVSTSPSSNLFDSWKNISSITLGPNCILGLEINGTLIGLNVSNLPTWNDISMIKAGDYQLCGLTTDGTLLVHQLVSPPTEDDFKKRVAPALGMSSEQVLQSTWKQPESIACTTNSDGLTEQWNYSNNRSIIFLNGIVISIQEQRQLPTS